MSAVLPMATVTSLDLPNEVAETRATSPQRRIEWMDTARGIAIILVVYGHVLVGLHDGGFFSTANPWWLSYYTIYTFHMPFFFFLAGLNVRRSIAKGRKAFLWGKVWTIAYPYFLWSAIQGWVQLEATRLAPSSVNHAAFPLSMEGFFLHPGSQFWFLYALFICHVVAFLAGRSKWILVPAGICSIILLRFSLGDSISHALLFYSLGIMLGSYVERWTPTLRTSLLAGFTGVLVFAVAVHLGRAASHGNAASLFSLPAALLGIGLLCLLGQVIARTSDRLTQILKTIGVMSMTIYILHIMADSVARLVLRRLGIESTTDQLLFGVIAGVALPMVAHVTLDKLHLLGALGLASWKRPTATHIEYRLKATAGA
jgi:fucose 4-O-acetylase-like acetyltransferase